MNIIKEIQNEFNETIKKFDIDKLKKIQSIIKNHKKNIFITGIGKCENVAYHFIDLLKSISYKAFHISIQNSSHGDIGCVHEDDLVIVFSKSGNTKELIDFLEIIKRKKIYSIGISCNPNNKINNLTQENFIIPLNNEIISGISKIPNNSCMMMVVFINIICKMVENIKLDEYKENHLGGTIGNDLKNIKQMMIIDYPYIILSENMKILDILLKMTNKKIGYIIFKDNNENIIGVMSDGDIRRFILKNKEINNIKLEDINQNYFKLDDTNILLKDIKSLLLKYKFIPVVQNKKCIGLLHENIIKNNYY